MRRVAAKKSPLLVVAASMLLLSCAPAEFPGARTAVVEPPKRADKRLEALNERHQALIEVPLGDDVLVPMLAHSEQLPDVTVGPYELRSETLANALQLVLGDFDISIAFEVEEGLSRQVTVTNLQGKLSDVVARLCAVADLYCTYEDGTLAVKENETFVVDLPPLGAEALQPIVEGLKEIIGPDPILDTATGTIVYTATQRTSKRAAQYFERLRKSTALIVYETHIWEVSLNNENRAGINWQDLVGVKNFDIDLDLPGGAPTGTADPITITPTYTGGNLDFTAVFDFISAQGAVKTVSQPQLTVLSGSTATMTTQRSQNYVSEITRTIDNTTGDETVSTSTGTVNTGLTMTVTSGWDKATVYGTIEIQLNDLIRIQDFSPTETSTIQLPETTTRSLRTQVRVRPGDTILIAGIVTERDAVDRSGPGAMTPILDTARSSAVENSELVFLLRPRVVAYVDKDSKEVVQKGTSPDASDLLPDDTQLFSMPDEKDKGLPLGNISVDALAPDQKTPEQKTKEEKDAQ